MFDNTFVARVAWKVACALVAAMCLIAWGWSCAASGEPAMRLSRQGAIEAEPPSHWEGAPLRLMALSDVEERFASRFPGTLARMTDGERVLVLRTVRRPTRMLHPAVDCYRGLGFRIAAERLQLDGGKLLWRCFQATRGGQTLDVCERIVGENGESFTDTSAWYWAALVGGSTGPWRAITIARPL